MNRKTSNIDISLKVTEINSEVLTQSEKPVDFNTTKTQEGFLSKIFSLMNKNPNYKMLGALGMMLVNFSVCVSIANWLNRSDLSDEIADDALNAMRFLSGEVTSAVETSLARVYDVDPDELASLLFPED